MSTYTKPACPTVSLLEQWQSRGMHIPNMQRAERYLTQIGYYRLSAYTIPFQQASTETHCFKLGVCFDDILSLYVFDRELRLLVLDALERIEIAVRANICNHMSITYADPFWYTTHRHFKQEYQHSRLVSTIQTQLNDEARRMERDESFIASSKHLSHDQKQKRLDQVRKANFVRHYISKYTQNNLPPCWMMVEMLTWGDLSFLYDGLLSSADQKAIAQGLGTHAELLISWIKALNDIRNICAHHGRLWNKEFGRSVKIPKSNNHLNSKKWLMKPVVLTDPHIRFEKRLYPAIVVIQSLLYTICPYTSWPARLHSLLHKYPDLHLASMGIPPNWYEDPFWQHALQQIRPEVS